MSIKTSPAGNAHEPALLALFQAIVSRDRSAPSRLLRQSPLLARQVLSVGATREAPSAYFFPQISHYAYAGDTPLHLAAAAYQTALAEELVKKGANVSARNRRGAEPLHYAADGAPGSETWNPDAQHATIAFLIGAGANPNSTDKSGVSPLHRAVRTRCTGAVRALLANGADVRGRNANGSTPLHLAVQDTGRGGSGSVAAREEQQEIIQLLLDHGARVTDQDGSGKAVKDCVKAGWIHARLGPA